ncbi:MAG: RtcB family protein [Spirochaetaceae bacterium]|jgi:RNA-splicing ligase RtcB|nr:RtcB family protein [Spirochaetaceae bacterium]
MNTITLNGVYADSVIYAKGIEVTAEDTLLRYQNNEVSAGSTIRIMPDVHAGKNSVVGFTATLNDCVVPSIIGVDIGYGISAYNLGKGRIGFEKLDRFIRKNIPFGTNTRYPIYPELETVYDTIAAEGSFQEFKSAVRRVCEAQGQIVPRVLGALGSLGGGNHFIEIDHDEEKNRWLLIHSGSRNFGYHIAGYHEEIAVKIGRENPIKFITGDAAEAYIRDAALAQVFAQVNRAVIAKDIIEGFFDISMEGLEKIESIHNYIDLKDRIVRKGAISARAGERVLIPFSMSDGAVIAVGKGNPEWNYSAPHGAGRKIARSQAKGLSLDEYRKRMRGVWSNSINKNTLEESPMAYKRTRDILDYLPQTVDIQKRLLPVFNFKPEEFVSARGRRPDVYGSVPKDIDISED